MNTTEKVALALVGAIGAWFIFRPKSISEQVQVGDVATVRAALVSLDTTNPLVLSEQARDPSTMASMASQLASTAARASGGFLELPVLAVQNGIVKSRVPVPGGLDFPVTFPAGAIFVLSRNGVPIA